MRIIDDRQTGMFSYGDGICNRVGLNVEREDSTAHGGIEWEVVNPIRCVARNVVA
jgi:hypothetical protein